MADERSVAGRFVADGFATDRSTGVGVVRDEHPQRVGPDGHRGGVDPDRTVGGQGFRSVTAGGGDQRRGQPVGVGGAAVGQRGVQIAAQPDLNSWVVAGNVAGRIIVLGAGTQSAREADLAERDVGPGVGRDDADAVDGDGADAAGRGRVVPVIDAGQSRRDAAATQFDAPPPGRRQRPGGGVPMQSLAPE